MGVSSEGFEEQFRALLVAIEAGQLSMTQFTSKKERKLKILSASINYDGREGSVFRSKCKGRVTIVIYP